MKRTVVFMSLLLSLVGSHLFAHNIEDVVRADKAMREELAAMKQKGRFGEFMCWNGHLPIKIAGFFETASRFELTIEGARLPTLRFSREASVTVGGMYDKIFIAFAKNECTKSLWSWNGYISCETKVDCTNNKSIFVERFVGNSADGLHREISPVCAGKIVVTFSPGRDLRLSIHNARERDSYFDRQSLQFGLSDCFTEHYADDEVHWAKPRFPAELEALLDI